MKCLPISKRRRREVFIFIILGLLSLLLLLCWSDLYDKLVSPEFSMRYNLDIEVRPKHVFNLKSAVLWEEGMNTIPHIIHQTAKSEQVPNIFKPWMRSWLEKNPRWQHWYWTDNDIRRFIATRYPRFLKLFDSYPKNVERCDAFRYFLLYEFGGFYADTDVQCLQPLEETAAQHKCIITPEPPIHALFFFGKEQMLSNAIMASRPRHPFLKFVINRLRLYQGYVHPVFVTGPAVLADSYHAFTTAITHTSNSDRNIPYIPTLWDEYQPKYNPRCIERFNTYCNQSREVNSFRDHICKEILSPGFTNGPKNISKTIHHWTNVWADEDLKYGIAAVKGSFQIQNLFVNKK